MVLHISELGKFIIAYTLVLLSVDIKLPYSMSVGFLEKIGENLFEVSYVMGGRQRTTLFMGLSETKKEEKEKSKTKSKKKKKK